MHLLLTVFAAVGATTIWYCTSSRAQLHLGLLCWLFWGASLMWLVDAVAEYIELGAAYFNPAPQTMLNDAFLGLSIIALALVVWLMRLLIADPRGVIRAKIVGKTQTGGKMMMAAPQATAASAGEPGAEPANPTVGVAPTGPAGQTIVTHLGQVKLFDNRA